MLACLLGVFWLWPVQSYRHQSRSGTLVDRLTRWRLVGLGLLLTGFPFVGSTESLIGWGAWPMSLGALLVLVTSMGLHTYRRYGRASEPTPVDRAER
jgi:hypothetical protein